jgi:hypothetical protein
MKFKETIILAAAVFTIVGVSINILQWVSGRPTLGTLVRRLLPKSYTVRLGNCTSSTIYFNHVGSWDGRAYELQPGDLRTLTAWRAEPIVRYDSEIKQGFQERLGQIGPALVTNGPPRNTDAAPLYCFTTDDETIWIGPATTAEEP